MNSVERLLYTGFLNSQRQRTQTTLGDRSDYVGMSDVGRAVDCLRAAVASKVGQPGHRLNEHGEDAGPTLDILERELRLQRGHWFEHGVGEAFAATGVPFLPQLTIRTEHQGVPLVAHPDFVFVTPAQGSPAAHVVIVEVKSCETIPETAYASHELQLSGQLGLLEQCWHRKCFSLPGQQKPSPFPELVLKELGVTLPESTEGIAIQGVLLCLSMGQVKPFGPYAPNAMMLDICTSLAKSIWEFKERIQQGTVALDDVPTAKGHHPLCDWCDWNADCPRFDGVTISDLEDDMLYLQSLKDEKELLSSRIRQVEEQLKMSCKGIGRTGEWLSSETLRVKVFPCAGKRALDKELLYSELVRHLDGDTASAILESAYKIGNSYERLHISRIN